MKKRAHIFKGLKAPLAAAAVVFAATLVLSAPLSIVSSFVDFERQGIAYSSAEGTIWNGVFTDLTARGAPLGDVSFRLSSLSVLAAAPAISFQARGGAVIGEGRLTIGPGQKVRLANVSADVRLGLVAPRGVFGEPARGVARVDIERIEFSRARGCAAAAGNLWTDVLDAPAKRFNLPAMPMTGAFACEGDRLLVTLSGANERAAADVTLAVDRSLAYEIIATARPSEEGLASALRGFGFEDDNGALTYGSAGVFTGTGS
ncbi:MAG: type II secretion system protein N [Oricola sp.]|jgi:hypothetical protein|nr:type II secretion system protein N [Oricola sp.]